MTRDVLIMEGRFDWGRYDFGTFRRRDFLTMGRFDCEVAGRDVQQRSACAGVDRWSTQVDQREQCYNSQCDSRLID